MSKTPKRRTPVRIALAALALVLVVPRAAGAQSLEEQTRRPEGTNSLHDDSERLKGNVEPPPTDSLDDDSMNRRGRTADQDGTNSLDDGSMDDDSDPD